VEEFERQLNIKAGETTCDRGITLETVNCLGACALGPIAVLDGQYFSNVDTVKVRQILEKAWGEQEEFEINQDQSVFPLEVSCPRCNHSLMDPGRLIDAHPSIRLVASFGLKHGFLRLSSLYGSYHIESEHEVPEEAVVHFFCPHCHAELKSPSNCIECGAPMVPMIIHGGGMGEICSRRGCKAHRLDLNGAVY
jgi:(2Fe-2S) ferredoxin